MKLIIDIDEKDYEKIKSDHWLNWGVYLAVKNGTPLPKGHGRLIDADKLKNICPTNKAMHHILHHAHTVVKADKEMAE